MKLLEDNDKADEENNEAVENENEENSEEIDQENEDLTEEKSEDKNKEKIPEEIEKTKSKTDDQNEEKYEYEALKHPPEGFYNSLGTLLTTVQDFAVQHGYAIVQKRSVTGKSAHLKCNR
jgi:hypothetical protein